MFNLSLKLLLLTSFLASGLVYGTENKDCDSLKFRERTLTKIGYAPTNIGITNISSFCSYKNWISSQLNNPNFYNDDLIESKFTNLISHNKNNLEITHLYNQDEENFGTKLRKEAEYRRITYALYSENRLREMMVWFWFNHFNIYGNDGNVVYFKSYEDIFRNNPFGNFKDILLQVTTHPSMLTYLDNDLNNKRMTFKSKKIGFNDNHARELFELHSMGVNGGYTEKDIHQMAKILSGFKSIDKYNQIYEGSKKSYQKKYESAFLNLRNKNDLMAFSKKNKQLNIDKVYDHFGIYSHKFHDTSDKIILNSEIKGSDYKELEQALSIIVEHPSTAYFISKKIGFFFLGDEPNQYLLDSMATTFIKTKGDIKAVLEVLLLDDDFARHIKDNNSFKNPYEFYISTSKLTLNGTFYDSQEKIAGYLHNSGFGIYSKITPEGYSLSGTTHLSANTISNYINFIYLLNDNSKEALNLDNMNSYYNLSKDEYIKFLISYNWFYR